MATPDSKFEALGNAANTSAPLKMMALNGAANDSAQSTIVALNAVQPLAKNKVISLKVTPPSPPPPPPPTKTLMTAPATKTENNF